MIVVAAISKGKRLFDAREVVLLSLESTHFEFEPTADLSLLHSPKHVTKRRHNISLRSASPIHNLKA